MSLFRCVKYSEYRESRYKTYYKFDRKKEFLKYKYWNKSDMKSKEFGKLGEEDKFQNKREWEAAIREAYKREDISFLEDFLDYLKSRSNTKKSLKDFAIVVLPVLFTFVSNLFCNFLWNELITQDIDGQRWITILLIVATILILTVVWLKVFLDAISMICDINEEKLFLGEYAHIIKELLKEKKKEKKRAAKKKKK